MVFLRFFVTVALTLVCGLAAVDVVVRRAMPILPRFQDNFSTAYARYAIAGTDVSRSVVMLGDSVLWGFRLPYPPTAASILTERGIPVVNYAYEGGSLCNTYAMLRLLQAAGKRPRLVVFNVNIKEFNAGDSAYNTLYPAVEQLTWPLLTPDERALLVAHAEPQTIDARADRTMSEVWMLYGMRSDIRQLFFHQADAARAVREIVGQFSGRNARTDAAHRPTPDRFLGTYDLSPLTGNNVEVRFLDKTVRLLADWHVNAIAILSPANHVLLHDYIDVPDYDDQLGYLTKLMRPSVRVLNYDRTFAASEFFDNDHLTAAGNQHLATLLEPVLRP